MLIWNVVIAQVQSSPSTWEDAIPSIIFGLLAASALALREGIPSLVKLAHRNAETEAEEREDEIEYKRKQMERKEDHEGFIAMLASDHVEYIQQERNNLQDRVTEYEKNIKVLQNDITQIALEKEKLRLRLEASEKERINQGGVAESQSQQITLLEQEKATLRLDIDRINQILRAVEKRADETEKEREILRIEIDSIREFNRQSQKNLSRANQQLERNNSEIDDLKRQLEVAHIELKELKEKCLG